MSSQASNPFAARPLWLRILHINDVYELDQFPSFKTLVDAKKAEGPDCTLVVLGGDFLGPSLLSSLDHAVSMVDCMNSSGVTHVCFGNHETDVGPAHIPQRIQQSNFVWVNTNMPDINQTLKVQTPDMDLVQVSNGRQTKTVALLGLLTNDPSLYRPGAFGDATIEDVTTTAQRYVEKLNVEKNVDFILPLTHQSMNDDREFARSFGGSTFPLILGGHDHIPFDEIVNGCRIFKTGHDAEYTGIIDIQWDSSSEAETPTITTSMIPTDSYPADLCMVQRVEGHRQILHELDEARLFQPDSWMGTKIFRCLGKEEAASCDAAAPKYPVFSTQKNRLGTSTGSTAFATLLRMGMRVQCCILNAGSVRGNQSYPRNASITWKILMAEMPFPTYITAGYLPGSVIEATITHGRRGIWEDPPVARGGFIHTCTNIEYDNATRQINRLAGKPFDPDQKYLCCFPIQFLEGIDNHVPFLEFVATAPPASIIPIHLARACKTLVAEVCSVLIWLELGSFFDLDVEDKGYIEPHDLTRRCSKVFGPGVSPMAIHNIWSVADRNNRGKLFPIDFILVHFLATDIWEHVITEEEPRVLRETVVRVLGVSDMDAPGVSDFVTQVYRILDPLNAGKISRNASIQALGRLRNQSLLE